MKKIIVILAVLILVVCSVFADERQIVRIKTTVESKNPTFILRAGLSSDSFDRESDDAAMSTLDWETIEKSIQQEDITVFFQIAQKDYANKVGERFSLIIEASGMVMSLKEDGTTLAPGAKIYTTTKGSISDVTPVNIEKSNVGVTLSETAAKDAVSLVTQYSGKVEDGTPIATFAVTWTKDINAPDGIYQASVILKVSPL